MTSHVYSVGQSKKVPGSNLREVVCSPNAHDLVT